MDDSEQDSHLYADCGRYYGKYRGTVDSNETDEFGRITVTCESVLDDVKLKAMPCVPYAGKEVGFRFLPEKGDNIWVEFEGGDPSLPIWSGCYWKKGEYKRLTESSDVKIIETTKVKIEIDDGAGTIIIAHADGSMLEIKGNEITVTGKNKVTQKVGAMTTVLESTKFDILNGGLSVA